MEITDKRNQVLGQLKRRKQSRYCDPAERFRRDIQRQLLSSGLGSILCSICSLLLEIAFAGWCLEIRAAVRLKPAGACLILLAVVDARIGRELSLALT
jgi:hypothetical protein